MRTWINRAREYSKSEEEVSDNSSDICEVLTLLLTRGLKYRNNETRILPQGIPILQRAWTTRKCGQKHTTP